MNTTIGCPIPGASQPIQLDENNNFIDPVTGELMHQMTVEEMPTKQELMLGAELYAPNAVRPTAEWIEAPDEGAYGSWEACFAVHGNPDGQHHSTNIARIVARGALNEISHNYL